MSGVSLILSSYNQPRALERVLAGVAMQRDAAGAPAFAEVVIGDDGSEADTSELVAEFAKTVPFPVRFEAQEDQGFRKSRALNNAIRVSTGSVLLFLDGDCVPPPGWAQRYLDTITSGVDFATAGYVMWDTETAASWTAARITAGELASACTPEQQEEFRRIHRKERFYRLIRKPKKPKILGGNWAATRECVFAVNGFDERFDGFGKEDSDIRNRLRNAGFRGRSLWDCNWVFHCSHDLDPRRNLPEVVRRPPDREYYASRKRATTCEIGIRQPPAPAQ